MLIGTGTRKIDLPHEEGQWIEVKDLTRKVIQESKRLKMLELMEAFAGKLDAFMGKEIDPDAQITLESYDIDTVLEFAVVGWSYDTKFSPDLIAQLDQRTAEFTACDLLGIEEGDDKVKD